MRQSRTSHELAAINMVKKILSNSNIHATDDSSIIDSPDWVFEVDGRRFAAECTCINLERLMSWSNTKRELIPDKGYKVTFPNEPHFWIKKAIEDKEGKIPNYLANSNAEEIWLITHSEFDSGLSLYECNDTMLEGVSRAAASLDSQFSRIFFVHSEAGAYQIWEKGDPLQPFPEYEITGKYPSFSMTKFAGTITKDGYNLVLSPENEEESIIIQPIDKRYKL